MIRQIAKTHNERKLTMRPHERLKLWKRAVEFVVRIYRLTNSFPKEEKFGLTSQIRRDAVSVPGNIAEVAGRQSDKEFFAFFVECTRLSKRTVDRTFDRF